MNGRQDGDGQGDESHQQDAQHQLQLHTPVGMLDDCPVELGPQSRRCRALFWHVVLPAGLMWDIAHGRTAPSFPAFATRVAQVANLACRATRVAADLRRLPMLCRPIVPRSTAGSTAGRIMTAKDSRVRSWWPTTTRSSVTA